MSWKDITPGTKVAKPVSARYMESGAKKTPGIEIEFDFVEKSTDTPERIRWIGWMSEGAKARTMDTLYDTLGCNGSEDTDWNGMFTDPNFLKYDQECTLEVEEEFYEGKSRMKVKWVNKLGGSNFGAVAPELVKTKVASLGLKAAGLARNVKPASDAAPGFDSSEEVPW